MKYGQIEVVDFVRLQLPLDKVLKRRTPERKQFIDKLLFGINFRTCIQLARIMQCYDYRRHVHDHDRLVDALSELEISVDQQQVIIMIDDFFKVVVANDYGEVANSNYIYEIFTVDLDKQIKLIESATGNNVVLVNPTSNGDNDA